MIALEHIQPDDWAAVNRVVDVLRSLVLDAGGQSLSIRAGTVSAAGAVVRGQGFTVTKGTAGLYTINQAWARAPTVVVGLGSTSSITGAAVSPAPSTTGFGVATFGSAGLANAEFHWIAIG
jgi:hypothetical protein